MSTQHTNELSSEQLKQLLHNRLYEKIDDIADDIMTMLGEATHLQCAWCEETNARGISIDAEIHNFNQRMACEIETLACNANISIEGKKGLSIFVHYPLEWLPDGVSQDTANAYFTVPLLPLLKEQMATWIEDYGEEYAEKASCLAAELREMVEALTTIAAYREEC